MYKIIYCFLHSVTLANSIVMIYLNFHFHMLNIDCKLCYIMETFFNPICFEVNSGDFILEILNMRKQIM